MKKWIAMLLALVMMFTLAACGGNGETGNNDGTTPDAGETQGNNGQPAETTEGAQAPAGELTVETLRNHPETPASEFRYSASLDFDGILIEAYLGNDDIVVIPATIDGQPVVDIAEYCFANDSAVRGVVIPNSVKEIAELFANNDDVELVIAEGLERINYFAFGNCPSLKEVVLGDDLYYIGELAFGGCVALETLHIPPTVKDLTEEEYFYALGGCLNLTIYGEAGSFIEQVANELGIPFVAE